MQRKANDVVISRLDDSYVSSMLVTRSYRNNCFILSSLVLYLLYKSSDILFLFLCTLNYNYDSGE